MDLKELKIGQKIKKLRELKNLNQQYVAKEVGMTQGAYSKIEQGDSDLSYSKLEKISEALGLKPEDVISFNDQMVFNVSNNNNGGNVFGHVSYGLSENEIALYEQQIDLLKKEVDYLKSVLDKILGKQYK
jgi:transcriptional regulator with XRE-family HTH domain